jgi:integrase
VALGWNRIVREPDKTGRPVKANWTIHDLRRTARSLMSRKEARIPRDIAERVLGHAIGGTIEQTYDRHAYTVEKGEALAALAALIERILSPADKVIELAQHRA